MAKDWKEARQEELEKLREKYEEAKQLVETEGFQKSQAAFISEILNLLREWSGDRAGAYRIVSIAHYLTMKMVEPLDIINEYERKRKALRTLDPDAN